MNWSARALQLLRAGQAHENASCQDQARCCSSLGSTARASPEAQIAWLGQPAQASDLPASAASTPGHPACNTKQTIHSSGMYLKERQRGPRAWGTRGSALRFPRSCDVMPQGQNRTLCRVLWNRAHRGSVPQSRGRGRRRRRRAGHGLAGQLRHASDRRRVFARSSASSSCCLEPTTSLRRCRTMVASAASESCATVRMLVYVRPCELALLRTLSPHAGSEQESVVSTTCATESSVPMATLRSVRMPAREEDAKDTGFG